MTEPPENDEPSNEEDADRKPDSAAAVCERCNGMGLICGYETEVGPDNCCIDFLNTVCPECHGTGLRPTDEKP